MALFTDPVLALFASFFVFLIIRMPVAVALAMSSMVTLLVDNSPLLIIVQRLFAGAYSWILLAIPFFTLAGLIMEKGGVTQRIVNFANALLGVLPGGLAAVNIGSSMIFGGISGSAVADSSAIGTLLIPAMRQQGYSSTFSAAVTASSSPIGMIIPPSIPMVLWSFVSGVSLGALFLGGVIPGLLVGVLEILLATLISIRRGYKSSARFSLANILRTGWDALLALLAPLIIIVGIVAGVFTPTEAAVIAVAYTLFLSMVVYKGFGLAELPSIFIEAGKTTAMIMFIVAGASLFSWIMAYNDIPQKIAEAIMRVAQGPGTFMLIACALIFIFGMFMDVAVIVLLIGPILAPLVQQMGIDPIQGAMVFMIVLATGLITPPVGLCLFVVAGISGDPVEKISVECLPFLGILLLLALLVWFFPALTLWIPAMIMG